MGNLFKDEISPTYSLQHVFYFQSYPKYVECQRAHFRAEAQFLKDKPRVNKERCMHIERVKNLLFKVWQLTEETSL